MINCGTLDKKPYVGNSRLSKLKLSISNYWSNAYVPEPYKWAYWGCENSPPKPPWSGKHFGFRKNFEKCILWAPLRSPDWSLTPPLYQRLSSLLEQKIKCFLKTFWATPLYLHCEPFIFMFPAKTGVVSLSLKFWKTETFFFIWGIVYYFNCTYFSNG